MASRNSVRTITSANSALGLAHRPRIAGQVPAPFGGVEVRPVWPAG